MSGPRSWSLPRDGGMYPPPPPPGSAGWALRAARRRVADASRRAAAAGVLRPGRLPSFLGIGAQKSGTTWLHANLSAHPEIFLPEAKELHWLDWNWHRTPRAYARWFEAAGDRLAGEITPAYAIADSARIRAAVAVLPEVRAIYLVRDPVERAWSQAVMNLHRHGEVAPDEATLLEHLASEPVLARSRHSSAIDRWSEAIGQERLLIGFFEEVGSDPEGLLRRTLRFLGVDPDPEVEFPLRRVVNRGDGVEMPEAARRLLVDRLADELIELERRFGEPAAGWRARWCP